MKKSISLLIVVIMMVLTVSSALALEKTEIYEDASISLTTEPALNSLAIILQKTTFRPNEQMKITLSNAIPCTETIKSGFLQLNKGSFSTSVVKSWDTTKNVQGLSCINTYITINTNAPDKEGIYTFIHQMKTDRGKIIERESVQIKVAESVSTQTCPPNKCEPWKQIDIIDNGAVYEKECFSYSSPSTGCQQTVKKQTDITCKFNYNEKNGQCVLDTADELKGDDNFIEKIIGSTGDKEDNQESKTVIGGGSSTTEDDQEDSKKNVNSKTLRNLGIIVAVAGIGLILANLPIVGIPLGLVGVVMTIFGVLGI